MSAIAKSVNNSKPSGGISIGKIAVSVSKGVELAAKGVSLDVDPHLSAISDSVSKATNYLAKGVAFIEQPNLENAVELVSSAADFTKSIMSAVELGM
jgi:hypothetical protein